MVKKIDMDPFGNPFKRPEIIARRRPGFPSPEFQGNGQFPAQDQAGSTFPASEGTPGNNVGPQPTTIKSHDGKPFQFKP